MGAGGWGRLNGCVVGDGGGLCSFEGGEEEGCFFGGVGRVFGFVPLADAF